MSKPETTTNETGWRRWVPAPIAVAALGWAMVVSGIGWLAGAPAALALGGLMLIAGGTARGIWSE